MSSTAQSLSAPRALSSVTAPAAGHLDFLDGLRGMAALYVVLGHAWLTTWPEFVDGWTGSQNPRVWASLGWLMYGHFTVTLFITLSGFCLMIPVLRAGHLCGGARGFLVGRARRILPPYYAALLGSLALAVYVLHPGDHTLFNYYLPVSRFAVISHLLLIHDLFQNVRTKISVPLWSIGVECQIYLFFPMLVWLWVRRGAVAMLAVAITISAALLMVGRWVGDADLVPHYLTVFAMGMLSATQAFPEQSARMRRLAVRPRLALVKAAGILSGIAVAGLLHHFRFYHTRPIDLVVGFTGCCLLVVAARDRESVVHRVISWRPLVRVGGFSYSLYLIHSPLQQLFLQQVVDRMHVGKVPEFFLMAVVGTALLLPISFGFYRVVERPFMRSKQTA